MSSVQASHPLPAPPGQGQQQYGQQYQSQTQQHPRRFQAQPQSQPQPQPQPQTQTRPRAKSSFSFRSNKSHKSQGSDGKIDLHESSLEKASRRLTSKADPLLAMSEAEPSAIANQTSSRLAPLRAIEHKDHEGVTIADPDRSNPTRNRWERPLDTIRAFEAAIDGNYSRKSFMRTESSPSIVSFSTVSHNNNFARRSSYYAGSNVSTATSRHPQDAYYAGRNSGYRPDSYFDHQNFNNRTSAYRPDRARYPRTASEPVFNAGMSVYPQNANQQSYETVTTASGSGSSADRDPQGYYTDPSSENSSIDRTHGNGKLDHGENYGVNGYQNHGLPHLPPQTYGQNRYGMPGSSNEQPYMTNGHANAGAPPPVPRHAPAPAPAQAPAPAPRVPIKLGSSSGATTTSPGQNVFIPPRPGGGEKRKSWFGRRFSKQ